MAKPSDWEIIEALLKTAEACHADIGVARLDTADDYMRACRIIARSARGLSRRRRLGRLLLSSEFMAAVVDREDQNIFGESVSEQRQRMWIESN